MQDLLKSALEARENAYVPYSHFAVGAALRTMEGKIYTGCNIENASYGLTVCAERVALFKAVSVGERNFVALAVVADTSDVCSPCGACRQVLAEFCPELKIMMANMQGKMVIKDIQELLPGFFKFDDMLRREV